MEKYGRTRNDLARGPMNTLKLLDVPLKHHWELGIIGNVNHLSAVEWLCGASVILVGKQRS